MRKKIIIIGTVVALAALAVGVYFAWRNYKAITTPPTGPTPIVENQKFPTGGTPSTGTGQQQSTANLRALSRQSVFDYWVMGSEVFYINPSGQIFKIGASNDETVISEPIENLQSIKITTDGKKILVKYGDLSNPRFTVLNVETKTSEAFPSAQAAVFSPDSKRIAYLDKSNPANLYVKDIASKSIGSRILSVNVRDYDLAWITPERILLVPKPSYRYDSQIWAVNIGTKNLALVTSGRGLMVGWSSDGTNGIRFRVDEKRVPELNLIDKNGNVLAALDFLTFPDKCRFAVEFLYCGLPQSHNFIGEPVLPDDYLKNAVHVSDFIYRIGTRDNVFEPLFVNTKPNIDVTRASLVGSNLLFINRYDNKLYSLELTTNN